MKQGSLVGGKIRLKYYKMSQSVSYFEELFKSNFKVIVVVIVVVVNVDVTTISITILVFLLYIYILSLNPK